VWVLRRQSLKRFRILAAKGEGCDTQGQLQKLVKNPTRETDVWGTHRRHQHQPPDININTEQSASFAGSCEETQRVLIL
jgi:hypothetical protein